MIRTAFPSRLVACGAFLTAALIACSASANPPARTDPATPARPGAISGQWLIEPARRAGTMRLTLQRREGSRHQMSSSDDIPASQLRGLDWKQAQASPGAVFRFQIARDAGSFACEGWFRLGEGSGHFTFAPDPGFRSELRGLGYPGLSSDQIFSLAVHDVTRALIRELGRLGYQRIPYEQLIAMRIHGATPAYIRALAALGYRNIEVDQLIAMRIHGVSPEGIRELAALGYPRLDTEQLVAMRIHGVDPELVRELRAEGYRGVPAEKLVAMRIHGVSPDFIRRLRKRGYDKLSIDELISLKIHGVAR
jgi:hypothetical protein